MSIEKIIKRNQKSKFQNCFQCKFFPKDIENSPWGVNVSITKWCWDKENVEVMNFRCQYLRKRISQATKPWRTNSCLCFKRREG